MIHFLFSFLWLKKKKKIGLLGRSGPGDRCVFNGLSASASDPCCIIVYWPVLSSFCFQGPVSFAGSDREGVSVIYQLQGRRHFIPPLPAHQSARPLLRSLDVLCGYDLCDLLSICPQYISVSLCVRVEVSLCVPVSISLILT